jgi:hypothetical protein
LNRKACQLALFPPGCPTLSSIFSAGPEGLRKFVYALRCDRQIPQATANRLRPGADGIRTVRGDFGETVQPIGVRLSIAIARCVDVPAVHPSPPMHPCAKRIFTSLTDRHTRARSGRRGETRYILSPSRQSAAYSPPRAAASGTARKLPARSTIKSRFGDPLALAKLGYFAAAGFRLLSGS